MKKVLLAASCLAGVAAAAPTAYAQEQVDRLEEIVVTASRRAQTVSDIPIAVTAVTGVALTSGDIRDIAELSSNIPNFKAGNGGYLGEAVAIRGLGTGQDRAFEQAVGLYVDGVYFPRSRAYRSAFFDLDRVEVMRGPQAVLQGLNSTAGAVSVITRKAMPGAAFSLNATGGVEFEQGGYSGEAASSFSPAEWLGVRAAVRYGQDGAYYFNTTTQKEENERRDFAARLTVTAALNDTTTFTVKYDHSYYKNDGSEGEAVGARSPLAGLFPSLADDGVADWRRTTSAVLLNAGAKSGFFRSDVPRSRAENDGVLGDLTTEIAGGTLSLVGAYYRSTWDHDLDVDATNATFLEGGNYEKYNQKSASLQYVSQSGKPLEYVIGGYYQRGVLDFVIPNGIDATAFGIPLGIGYTGRFHQTSELFSAFGSATYHVTSALRLVGGLRYVDESKDVNVASDCSWRSLTDFSPIPDAAVGIPVNAIGLCSHPGVQVPGGVNRSRTSTPLMFETSAQYDLTPDLMVYAKYSTSSKSGGFSAGTEVAPENLEFDDEKARGLEAGLKSTLFDGRMGLSLTAFRTLFKDLQLKSDISNPTTGQTLTVVSNAGRSRSQGVELELRYRASADLALQISGGYLDAKFTRFTTAPCGVSNTPPPGAAACDFSGRTMPFAADWTANVAAQWAPPISDSLKAIVEPSVEFSSSYYTDGTLDEGGRQDAWAKIDLRLGVATLDDRWSLALVGKNLTDRRVIAGYQPTILMPVVFYGTPRTISLRLTYRR